MRKQRLFQWWKLKIVSKDAVLVSVISVDKEEIIKATEALKKGRDPEAAEIRIKNYKFSEDISCGFRLLVGFEMWVRNWEGKLYAANLKKDGSLLLLKVNEDDLI